MLFFPIFRLLLFAKKKHLFCVRGFNRLQLFLHDQQARPQNKKVMARPVRSRRGSSLNAGVSKTRTIDNLFMENTFEKFMQWQRECSHLLIKLQSQEQEEELKDGQNP